MPARLPRVEIGNKSYNVENKIINYIALYNMTIFSKRFTGRVSCLPLKN
jgi:hypothetical protein